MSASEFMEGLAAASGLGQGLASERYRAWLEREGYSEAARIDLEGGGYWAGLEVGREIVKHQRGRP